MSRRGEGEREEGEEEGRRDRGRQAETHRDGRRRERPRETQREIQRQRRGRHTDRHTETDIQRHTETARETGQTYSDRHRQRQRQTATPQYSGHNLISNTVDVDIDTHRDTPQRQDTPSPPRHAMRTRTARGASKHTRSCALSVKMACGIYFPSASVQSRLTGQIDARITIPRGAPSVVASSGGESVGVGG